MGCNTSCLGDYPIDLGQLHESTPYFQFGHIMLQLREWCSKSNVSSIRFYRNSFG